jgi:dipeptidyl aminopeptidase/acylaminoacyl peptidase
LAYCKAISGDWGNLEMVDLHAVVDELVKQGIADPNKLGVGGWSYGGILTDYLIATDTRFKAAVSGAGVGFTMSLYGVDQYIMQYDNEIGPPWKSLDTYLKLGYPSESRPDKNTYPVYGG